MATSNGNGAVFQANDVVDFSRAREASKLTGRFKAPAFSSTRTTLTEVAGVTRVLAAFGHITRYKGLGWARLWLPSAAHIHLPGHTHVDGAHRWSLVPFAIAKRMTWQASQGPQSTWRRPRGELLCSALIDLRLLI